MKKIITTIFIVIFSIFSTYAKVRTVIYSQKEIEKKEQVEINMKHSLELFNANIRLGWNIEKSEPDGILFTINKIEELVIIDIIEMLELSSNKNKTLTEFIEQSDDLLHKINLYIATLEQEVNLLKSRISECTLQKESSDQQYFNSIKDNDEIQMKHSLEESTKLSSCISENKTQYNAKLELLNMSNFYFTKLGKKQFYLEQNKDLIVNHFDIIKTNLLQELEETKNILKYQNF